MPTEPTARDREMAEGFKSSIALGPVPPDHVVEAIAICFATARTEGHAAGAKAERKLLQAAHEQNLQTHGDSREAAGRIAGLEEAAKAECHYCADGVEAVLENRVWVHRRRRKSGAKTHICLAFGTRKIIARAKAEGDGE